MHHNVDFKWLNEQQDAWGLCMGFQSVYVGLIAFKSITAYINNEIRVRNYF